MAQKSKCDIVVMPSDFGDMPIPSQIQRNALPPIIDDDMARSLHPVMNTCHLNISCGKVVNTYIATTTTW